ncbi:MAG: bifunctional [glutamate--ammonia ligase]-adenylyl-L-tyrosine phosphorylase/[glutamate--ammonia-ligase] adenylyltransferase, partial [Proteobacteria bacterium]|nr:bifunctional [glutamate--ammonia ligase]-adenylyl-L-tyrosine phosphorylase/[glutamate--ammonia-ligase] adenylyltransferase [Pseudomonadota bacterium]
MSTSTPPPLLALSRYANSLLLAHPECAPDAAADAGPVTPEFLAAALDGAADDDEPGLKTRLRRLRQRVLLRTMARDLSGAASLAEVCGAMTALAEASLRVTQDWARRQLEARYGVPRTASGAAQELIVVGMGKLGGGELNVSSDIDLVFVYPEEGETDGAAPLSAHEFFARLGQRLIAVLGEVNADGFVFRVDMRLRPYGESGPLVASLDALENYFVAQGREWERYAWIKARAITGTQHEALEAVVRPFVYRKYLDFATLAAMRRLHNEVRREVARRELVDHVKLGAGGIREIEFIAQALQLVRAGRDAALRVRPTLQVLARLTACGLLPAYALPELEAAYAFLRAVEHRLQYLDDRQTHQLPENDADRAAIARMSGFARWEDFSAALATHRDAVSRHFRDAFAETPDSGEAALWQDDREAVTALLGEQGFRDPEASSARLAAARSSQRYKHLPTDSRRRFNALVPALAAVAAAADDPDTTLARGLDLIEAIARRAPYLALLAERPEALERVMRMISASSWAADYVTQHPLLLDELLDDEVLHAAPDWPAFVDAMRNEISRHAGDVEAQMNILREQHQTASFRLLAQDLGNVLSLERIADHLSTLADVILDEALMLVWSQLRNRHIDGPPRFAVIAYGKLGGKELGYTSDLDIIFVYDDPAPEALEVYSRLAQRLN